MDLTQIGLLFGINVVALTESTAAVMVIIAAIKKAVPSIQGKVTMIISAVMAIIFGVTTNITLGVSGIPIMIISALLIWGGTVGAWELVKKVGGVTNGGTQ